MVHDAIHAGGTFVADNREYPAALLGCKSNNFSDHSVRCRIDVGTNPVQDTLKSKIFLWSSF